MTISAWEVLSHSQLILASGVWLQTCHSRRRTSPQDQKNFRHCSCHHCSIFRTYHLLSDLLKSNGINSCYYTFIPSVLPLPTHSTLLSFPIKLWDVFFFPFPMNPVCITLLLPGLGPGPLSGQPTRGCILNQTKTTLTKPKNLLLSPPSSHPMLMTP